MLTRIKDQKLIDELNKECLDSLNFRNNGYSNQHGSGRRKDGDEYYFHIYENQSNEVEWEGSTYICRELSIGVNWFRQTKIRPQTTQWYLVEEDTDG